MNPTCSGETQTENGCDYIFGNLGSMDGRIVQSLVELLQFSVYKPSDEVNGKEYHTVFWWTKRRK